MTNRKLRPGWVRHHPGTFTFQERAKKIIELREVEKLTYKEIAEQEGVTISRAWQLYKAAKDLEPEAVEESLSRGG